MQSNEEKKQQPAANADSPQDPELSDAWRTLLGMQPSGEKENSPQVDPAVQVQPLADDPWSHLLQSQGVQPVDLQKAHLHDLHPEETSNDDVEHALNVMREATGQLPSLKEKSGESQENR